MYRILLLAAVFAAAPACSQKAAVDDSKVEPGAGTGAAETPVRAPTDAATQQAVVASPFTLELELTSAEHSKDSHSYRYRCSLEGARMTYHGPYGECGRGQCEHKEVSVSLTGAEIVALVDEVRRAALPSSFEEKKPVNETGNSVQLRLTIEDDGTRHELVIEGMTSAWHPKRKASELSDEARRWVSAAERLRARLRDLARRELPTAH